MSEKTIYIGNGKKQKDNWLKSSICLDNIPKEHIFEYKGKKYIKVNINIKDEIDNFGKDVSITVDTWRPEQKEASNDNEEDDLPF